MELNMIKARRRPAAAQFNCVTAALARIYQTTHPSQFEQAVQRWREEVSDASNDHEERLAQLEERFHPKLILSTSAQELAMWLVATSPKGLKDPTDFETVRSAFPKMQIEDLQDAAAELALYGLAETSAMIGTPVHNMTPTYELFALFDPLVVNSSPQTDAVEIARLVLSAGNGDAQELEAKLGWPKRRLNPALALVTQLIGPGRVRNVLQPDYVTLGFVMAPEDRVRLRCLIERSA